LAYEKEMSNFLQYMNNGWTFEINVAIDFSAESADDHKKQGDANSYIKTIQSLMPILESYMPERMINVYGFGGIPVFIEQYDNTVGLFPLNGNVLQACVQGTQEILDYYNKYNKNIVKSGNRNLTVPIS